MCDACKRMKGHGVEPHANLVAKEFRKFRSPMGAADEQYYICKVCDTEIMYESGSAGYGWVLIEEGHR